MAANWIFAATLLVALKVCGGVCCQAPTPEPAWRFDLTVARKEAQHKGRPIMVFVRDSVGYSSSKMETTTFRDRRVLKLLSDEYIVVKLLAERNGELLKTHGIDVFPTVFFESSVGKLLGEKHVGYHDPEKMLQLLTKIQKKESDKDR